jgi:2-methylcitrate dehydratase PrpD
MTTAAESVTTSVFLDTLEARAKQIGSRTLTAAQTLLLDVLGVAIAGSRTPEGRSAARVMSATGRAGTIAVPASADRYDLAAAALVGGTAAYSIGLTDTHAQSITHPGPSIVPAALAVAQHAGATGEQLLRAIVLGCETAVRIGAVVNPSHRARGYHPTATCNPFGAALAAGVLLRLSREELGWALGLAGSMSGGLYEFRREGAMLMALHGGLPAASGVTAAFLAADGFTGPSTVLEGPEGFFRAFADEVRLEQLIPANPAFAVEELSLRPYCACRYAHAAIDAIEQLAGSRGAFRPADIERVTVLTHRTAVEQETEPVSVVGARLSTRFNVALALVHGPRLSEVTQEDLTDSAVLGMAGRIEVAEDPELTAIFPRHWACRVRIYGRDGRTLERRVDSPLGEPDNPMSRAQVLDKFTRLAAPVLGEDQVSELRAAVLDLPESAGIERVVEAMTSSAASPARGGDA